MGIKQLAQEHRKKIEENERKRKLIVASVLFTAIFMMIILANVLPGSQLKGQMGGGQPSYRIP